MAARSINKIVFSMVLISITLTLTSCKIVDNALNGTIGFFTSGDISPSVTINEGQSVSVLVNWDKPTLRTFDIAWKIDDPNGRMVASNGLLAIGVGQTSAAILMQAQTNLSVDGNVQLLLSISSNGLFSDLESQITVIDQTTPAFLSLTDFPLFDFGAVQVGLQSTRTFTLSNAGDASATLITPSGLSGPFDFLGASYPGTAASCSSTLAGHSSCSLIVAYTPIIGGSFSNTFMLSYNNGAGAQALPLNLQGTAAAVVAAFNLATLPADPSSLTVLNTEVNGTGITDYRYKVVPNSGDCTDSTGYSVARPVATNITDNVSAFPDGVLKICVVGTDLTYWQLFSMPTIYTWTKDTAAPTLPTISINSAATHTNTTASTLTLSAISASQMYVTNIAACASGGVWETYATSKAWTLIQTNSTATVYVKYRDVAGNESPCINDTIIHDTVAPVNPVLTVNSNATYTISLSNTLNVSGTTGDEIYITETAGCASGSAWQTYSVTAPFSLSAGDGAKVVYAKIRDFAGNESSCENDGIILDMTLPTVSISKSSDQELNPGSLPVSFRATFSEAVDFTNPLNSGSLLESDITNSGTAANIKWVIDKISNTEFDFHATGARTTTGTIRPTLAATTFKDLAGNDNAASTSSSDTISPKLDAIVFKQFAGGVNHICGLSLGGKVFCWGSNANGEVGQGTVGGTFDTPQILYTSMAFKEQKVVQIAASLWGYCAVTEKGEIYCWGLIAAGSLGDGVTTTSSLPVKVNMSAYPAAKPFKYVGGGGANYCGITMDGAVYCWGENLQGQIGDGTSGAGNARSLPTPIDTSSMTGYSTRFTEVGGGYNSMCGLNDENKVFCWGNGASGRLANGSSSSSSVPIPTVDTGVSGLKRFKKLIYGRRDTCAIGTDGNLSCWGVNQFGAVGDNTTTPKDIMTSIDTTGLPANTKFVDGISGMEGYTCALTAKFKMYCWGGSAVNNFRGLFGDDTPLTNAAVSRLRPSAPLAETNFTGSNGIVAAGGGVAHACIATSDGTSYCWGEGWDGRLGNGGQSFASPVGNRPHSVLPFVLGVSTHYEGVQVRQLVAGADHHCILTGKGQVFCWGSNASGQIGDGTFSLRYNAVTIDLSNIASPKKFVSISAGDYSTCGLLDSQELYCWGKNEYGEFKNGNSSAQPTPIKVSITAEIGTAQEFATILPNAGRICSLMIDGFIYCWGNNSNGELGNNSFINTLVAQQVVRGARTIGEQEVAVGIFSNKSNSCLITSDKNGYCWGNNFYGSLGDSSYSDRNAPTAITLGVTLVNQFVMGSTHACVNVPPLAAACVGDNTYGELGSATASTPTYTSVSQSSVTPSNSLYSLAAGNNYTCALNENKAAFCWGRNNLNQLGNMTGTPSSLPLAVSSPSVGQFTSLSSAGSSVCSQHTRKGIYCWGDNSSGQLGRTTSTPFEAGGIIDYSSF